MANRSPEELERDRTRLVDDALLAGADVEDVAKASGATFEKIEPTIVETPKTTGNITKVVDGDTFRVDGRKTRIKGIDTAESVHANEDLNTAEGELASQFATDLLPSGTEVVKYDYGKDHFKRDVSSVSKVVNGVELDFGLIALDQQLSTYKTKWGEHPDPMKHAQYKEYYSRYAPYQYGEPSQGITQEEYQDMINKHNNFSTTYSKFRDGEATQEQLDQAAFELYQDANKVVRFRAAANNWNKQVDISEHDGSTKFAFAWAMNSPEAREQYNRAVRRADLELSRAPEQEPSFWRKFQATWSQQSSMGNSVDIETLWDARSYGSKDFDLPDQELLKGVPEQWHSMILNEKAAHNASSAQIMKQNLLEDIENNEIIENMPLYAQFGYGVGVFAVDPLSYVAGGAAGATGKTVLNATRSWTASKTLQNVGMVGAWATGSAVESSIYNAPRLGGDFTYNSKDYQLDIMFETALGTGIGSAIEFGAKPLIKHHTQMRKARQEELRAIEARATNSGEQPPPVPETQTAVNTIMAPQQFEEYIKSIPPKAQTPEELLRDLEFEASVRFHQSVRSGDKQQEAIARKDREYFESVRDRAVKGEPLLFHSAKEELDARIADAEMRLAQKDGSPTPDELVPQIKAKAKADLKAWKKERRELYGSKDKSEFFDKPTPKKFVPLAAIDKVSNEGFKQISASTLSTFKHKSPLRRLMNYQKRLIDQGAEIDPALVSKLNADIIHIAAAFPDGRVPAAINSAIRTLTHTQKTTGTRHAMNNILKGDVSDITKELKDYVNHLSKLNIWKDVEYTPTPKRAFERELNDWLETQIDPNTGEMVTITGNLPPEMSMLKDVTELNNLASNSDADFRALVEHMNGMILARLDNMSVQIKDSQRSFGKTVPMTPPEIAAQLKKEGLRHTDTAYSKRLKELRQRGRVTVDEEVQQVGRVNTFQVGEQKTFDPLTDRFEGVSEEIAGSAKGLDVARMQELMGKSPTLKGLPKNEATQSKAEILKELESVDYWDLDPIDQELLKELREEIDLQTTKLMKDQLDQGLLPRSYSTTSIDSAYDNPTNSNMETLHKRLNSDIINKLGLKNLDGKKEFANQTVRMEKIYNTIQRRGKDFTVNKVANSKDISTFVDYMRVAATIAEENKLRPKQAGVETPKVLTEEDLDVLINPEKASPEVVKEVKEAVDEAESRLDKESLQKIAEHQTKFKQSGELRKTALAFQSNHWLDSVGKTAAKLTEDLASKFHKGDLDSLMYVGNKLTELGTGYGGAVKRKATGGLIRDHIFHESLLQIVPDYFHVMDTYAASKGRGAIGRMAAQQMAGADSKIVEQFNRDFIRLMEYRRQSKQLPTDIHESVVKFADAWEKYMEYNHNQLVDNKIAGFTSERKVKHYYPHIWRDGKLKGAISAHGYDKVVRLLTKAYESASTNKINPMSPVDAEAAAIDLIKWIDDAAKNNTDQHQPVMDSRAKRRKDLDTTMELEGLSVMDLLDTDVIGVGTKYSARTAGWVGYAKATDGMITSPRDIRLFKEVIKQEGKDKGVDTTKYEQYYDDLENLMLGRPTRGGLEEEFRQLKDLTDLTRMGGLGTAQLIESGQVITRSVINAVSRPSFASKVFKLAREDVNDKGLLSEIMSISSITDDIEHMYRQSVHLDQHELNKIKKTRQLTLWIADKATFGKLKAPASRLLGKTTGYNAVRRFQSRITQSSFALDVANHFKHNKGKMGNKRMADLGLTDIDGQDEGLKDAFNNIATWDDKGNLVRLNVDKWPKETLEQFQYAMRRDEAQQIQRTLIGELPPWMNKPMMALAFQFREMPIVAQNKSMARNMAFADKEATVALMLNAAMSGLVRYSKFALLAGGAAAMKGENPLEADTKDIDQVGVERYITQFGIMSDIYSFSRTSVDAYTEADPEKILREAPVYGLMRDYYDFTVGSEKQPRIDAAQGLTPLGNTAYGDMLYVWLEEHFD